MVIYVIYSQDMYTGAQEPIRFFKSLEKAEQALKSYNNNYDYTYFLYVEELED